ncbi:hypothetical protein [Flavobacterium panici]|uniref:Uncharacterized protein n=1 Tax=Flavobacterium panici TaxID=2654843 RepID=A0A9N8J4C6_9FLAO|nr:hypothetical protein [Flavobacterium panici]CAC9975938.1 hypothetical protein FLAPXU55_03659 [Flavobacterium panici]
MINQFYKVLKAILVIAVFISCDRQDDEFAINNSNGFLPESIIHFKKIDLANVEADGVSYSTVSIQINPEANIANEKVGLSTTTGKFVNGRKTDTITVNAYGVGYFTITNEKPERARITATVKSFSIDTIVNFQPALPHDILISADHFVIEPAQTITISASLIRDSFKGKVSDPIKVFYDVTPLTSQPNILIYPNFVMSSQGVSNAIISNPFNLTGDFKVNIKTLSPAKDTLRKSMTFRIQ